MPTRTFAALVAGALVAMAYSLSPITMWFLAVTGAATIIAVRGVEGRERVWVMGVIAAAVGLRLLAVALFFIVTHHGASVWFAPLLPDETYIAMRSIWLRNIALHVPIPGAYYVDSYNAYARTNFHELLALVQLWLGDASYGLRLVSAGLYVVGALVLFRTVRAGFGGLAAIVSLLAVLFLPTLFVWSISIVKEAPYALVVSVAIAGAVTAARPAPAPALKRAGGLLLAAVAIVIAGGLRSGAGTMLGVALAAGIAASVVVRRPVLLALVCVAALAGGVAGSRRPAVTTHVMIAVQDMVAIHIGHVMTSGYGYKLIEPEIYPGGGRSLQAASRTMDAAGLTRFGLRALASVVLIPLPWQAQSASALALLPEQMLWYLLVAAAIVGVVAGLRRDHTLTLILLAVVAASGVVVAVSNGNIGTLVRVRSMFVVPLLWLSGVGIAAILDWLAVRVRAAAGVPALQPARA